jgi:predicted RNase H-like nuclease (RuvC/YqgF family)
MKASKKGNGDPKKGNGDPLFHRTTLKNTIKIEQDKIADIKRRGIEDWKKKEMIAPLEENVSKLQRELDEFEQSRQNLRRESEAQRGTITMKDGGKVKAIKRC